MPETTYDMVAPNVADTRVNGASVDVGWKCPATGRDMGRSTAHMAPDPSMGGQVKGAVKQGLLREVVHALVHLVGRAMGSGAAGRIARDAAHSASNRLANTLHQASTYTEASRRAAIVEAFNAVAPRFEWDGQSKRFRARD